MSGSRRKVAIGSIVIIVLGACAGASANAESRDSTSAKGVTSGPSITPKQAKGIVKAWDASFDRPGAWGDQQLVRTESPPLLNADRPAYAANKAAGRPVPSPPHVITDVTVYVPHQTSFPAQFLAVVTYSNGGPLSINYYVFVKPTKSAPWRTPYQATFASGVTQPDIALDKKGYASVVNEAEARKSLKVDPATLGGKYASFLTRSAVARAVVPSTIFASEVASGIVKNVVDYDKAPFTFSVAVAPTRFPVYSYRTRGGGALAFFATTWDVRHGIAGNVPGAFVSIPTNALDYPANTHARFTNIKQIRILADAVPPKRDSALLSDAVAYYIGYTSIDWQPA